MLAFSKPPYVFLETLHTSPKILVDRKMWKKTCFRSMFSISTRSFYACVKCFDQFILSVAVLFVRITALSFCFIFCYPLIHLNLHRNFFSNLFQDLFFQFLSRLL